MRDEDEDEDEDEAYYRIAEDKQEDNKGEV